MYVHMQNDVEEISKHILNINLTLMITFKTVSIFFLFKKNHKIRNT